jgi:hypothetical protein
MARWLEASAIVSVLVIGRAREAQAQQFEISPAAKADLAQLRTKGDSIIKLVVLAKDGQAKTVSEQIRRLGGVVRLEVDTIGYIRARLLIDSVSRLAEIAPIENAAVSVMVASESKANSVWKNLIKQWLDSIRAVGDTLTLGGERRLRPAAGDAPMPLVATDWHEQPLERAYDPNRDNGVGALRRAHSTYDGRGVTVAQLEWAIDLIPPELGDSPALTLTGRATRKVADFLTTRDPSDPSPAPCCAPSPWVSMDRRVAAEVNFTIDNVSYTAPRPGSFRFGIYDAGFLCRQMDPKRVDIGAEMFSVALTEPCDFAVLWDDGTGDVWVDTDQDRSFANERALRDYSERFDVGVLGQDDPKTGARESYSFVVQTRGSGKGHFVGVLVASDHATMTAASAVGSRGSRGRFDGIAPGSRLIVYQAAGDIASVAEGLIKSMMDPQVDLVFDEIGGTGTDIVLGRGLSFVPLLVSRLARITGKPLVKAGGNCNSDGCADAMGSAEWTYSTGAMEGRDSWWINRAVRVGERDNNHRVNGWGPGRDGALLPTVLAPSGYLTAYIPEGGSYGAGLRPLYADFDRGLQGLYHMPAGYGIGTGTSQATPSLAGAIAVLISAAKQERVPYDAQRLWLAITNSARFSPNLPAHQQGNGTVDIDAAFRLLKAYASVPPSVRIVSTGPVRAAWSRELPVPNRGVSLFEREGWAAGMRGTRQITLTRTTGPAQPMRFDISWTGNDGTFAGPQSVTLPLGVAVGVPLTLFPQTDGYHSALLNVDYASIPGHIYRMMVAVVAAKQVSGDSANKALTIVDTLSRPGPGAYYIAVPSGAASLTLNVEADDLGGATWHIKDPSGHGQVLGDTWNFWIRGEKKTIENAEPGVWEVVATLKNDGLALRKASTGAAVDPPVLIKIRATVTRNPVP